MRHKDASHAHAPATVVSDRAAPQRCAERRRPRDAGATARTVAAGAVLAAASAPPRRRHPHRRRAAASALRRRAPRPSTAPPLRCSRLATSPPMRPRWPCRTTLDAAAAGHARARVRGDRGLAAVRVPALRGRAPTVAFGLKLAALAAAQADRRVRRHARDPAGRTGDGVSLHRRSRSPAQSVQPPETCVAGADARGATWASAGPRASPRRPRRLRAQRLRPRLLRRPGRAALQAAWAVLATSRADGVRRLGHWLEGYAGTISAVPRTTS